MLSTNVTNNGPKNKSPAMVLKKLLNHSHQKGHKTLSHQEVPDNGINENPKQWIQTKVPNTGLRQKVPNNGLPKRSHTMVSIESRKQCYKITPHGPKN